MSLSIPKATPPAGPSAFTVDEDLFDIAGREASLNFFEVETSDGKTFVLRHDEANDEWTLTSDHDGAALFSRPGIELITVDPDKMRKAERLIESCEACHPDDADIPFDWLLAEVCGKPGMIDFVLVELARCSNCKQPVGRRRWLRDGWANPPIRH
jgi:hypothetical protein